VGAGHLLVRKRQGVGVEADDRADDEAGPVAGSADLGGVVVDALQRLRILCRGSAREAIGIGYFVGGHEVCVRAPKARQRFTCQDSGYMPHETS
jgi:hypothetical protein